MLASTFVWPVSFDNADVMGFRGRRSRRAAFAACQALEIAGLWRKTIPSLACWRDRDRHCAPPWTS